jgi:hypothetical protein
MVGLTKLRAERVYRKYIIPYIVNLWSGLESIQSASTETILACYVSLSIVCEEAAQSQNDDRQSKKTPALHFTRVTEYREITESSTHAVDNCSMPTASSEDNTATQVCKTLSSILT